MSGESNTGSACFFESTKKRKVKGMGKKKRILKRTRVEPE